MNDKNSVRSIRNRLYRLLLRAFSIVVFTIFILMIISATWAVSYSPKNDLLGRFSAFARFETYYMSRNSWDGVDIIYQQLDQDELIFAKKFLLLNAEDEIILESGQRAEETKVYQWRGNELKLPIIVNDEIVGKIVLSPIDAQGIRIIPALSGLIPFFILSFILAILTIIIGLLLTRRVVTPLSEVIAASQAVANGKLNTRVKPEGPDDLQALSESFNQMAETLERNEMERRNMLADIAHELRTPLTVLRGRLEGIIDGIYEPNSAVIGPALESTYLLERLVEDLRLLTLAESRQLQFEVREINISNLLERVVDLFSAQAAEKQILIDLKSTSPDLVIPLDSQRTEQAIGNLINNALHYTPAKSHIWLSLEKFKDTIHLTVNDTGPGVLEEDLPFIFDRFWRKDKSRNRNSGGTGLGLAITKQLIEAQGGKIWAEINQQGGLTMQIKFDLPTVNRPE